MNVIVEVFVGTKSGGTGNQGAELSRDYSLQGSGQNRRIPCLGHQSGGNETSK